MSKFKTGDRVRINDTIPPMIGTVEDSDFCWEGHVSVLFDNDERPMWETEVDLVLNVSFDFERECISVFQWVEANPGCHPANIRSEILRLLNQHRENKKG